MHRHNKAQLIDRTSRNYQQGYFDGVRASENKLITSDKLVPPEQTDQLYLIDDKPPAELLAHSADAPDAQSRGGATEAAEDIIPATEVNQAASQSPADNQPTSQPAAAAAATAASQRPRNRDDDRRITANIALYVASLLVSAGATLLASVAGSDGLTVTSLIIFTAVYYGAGLLLHASVPLLRPVALAFIGTSLVLVPVAIGSLGLLLNWRPGISALTSSLFGVGMAGIAAIYANSAALGYVMILAVLSSGWSVSALIGASPAWYYATIMLVGIACSAIAKSGLKLPTPIQAPTATLSPILMPAALIITALSAPVVTQAELTAIFGVATLYYAVGARYAADDRGRVYEIIAARMLSIISAVLLAILVTPDGAYELLVGGLTFIAAATTHGLWSLYAILKQKKPAQHHRITLPMTSIGMLIGLLPLFGFTLTRTPDAALVGHSALFYSAAIIIFVQGITTYLLHQPHYYSSIIVSVIVGAFSAGCAMSELLPQHHDLPLMVVITGLLSAGIAALVARQLAAPRAIQPLAQAYLYGSVGLWWTIALITTVSLSPSIMPLAQSISFFVYSLGFFYAAWREHFVAAIAGAHISFTATIFFLLTHFAIAHDTAARISTWIGVGLMALCIEVLHRYIAPSRKIAAITAITAQAFISIVSVCVSLSITHPDIWLAITVVSYYALWRLNNDLFIITGHMFLLATVSSLFYHANLTGLTNVVATGWAGLGLLGGLYMLAYRHSTSLAGNATLAAATALPVTAAIVSLTDISSLIACAAWGGAAAASLLTLYAVPQPLVTAFFTIPSAVILSYASLATAGIAWQIAVSVVAFSWFIALCGGALLLQVLRAPRGWVRALLGSAAFWAVLFGTALRESSFDDTYMLLSTVLYLLSAGALAWEAIYSRLWWLLDVAGALILIGLSSLLDHHDYRLVEHAAIIRWHLWTITPLSLGVIYWRLQGYGPSAITRLSIAFSILTLGGLMVAIDGTLLAQLLFIAHHALIVIAGLITNRRLLSIWGAIGATLAVLWLLSSYVYLLYILIGIAIIIAVVYSIVRSEKRK
ncbi:MAG: hypothetical protein Q4A34_00590 [Candidatus Saccharibacteria bacterium]|nr:hypothetical protein [Candidatus Saccharibacteria bacterium]